jgi:excisionase family DNA binding protein
MPVKVSASEKRYKVREAAELLGKAENTMRNWIQFRKIAVYRVGGSILIPESEITRILEDGFRPAKS